VTNRSRASRISSGLIVSSAIVFPASLTLAGLLWL
jgi:hypothetical protein